MHRDAALIGNLHGRYRVKRIKAACHDMNSLFPRVRDRAEIDRHILKLADWPGAEDEYQKVQDLDWGWVRELPDTSDVGELRIDDEIGGHRDLCIVFHIGDQRRLDPSPIIWVLQIFLKKHTVFTSDQLLSFQQRRQWVLGQFYAS